MSDQPRHQRGTRLGYEPVVGAAWREYRDQRGNLENPVIAREVHYDVLRREGFSADRARDIAAESSERSHRLSEEMRESGHNGAAVAAKAERIAKSGFRIESILPSAITGE